MRRHGLAAILIATLVVLAGCTGGVNPGVGSTDDTTDAAAMEGTGSGTVQFYISDQPSAIGDFEHLNVTITQVGFQQADGDDDEMNETEESDDDETETTETADPDDNETESPNSTAEPETDDGDDAEEDDADDEEESDEAESEEAESEDEESDDADEEDADDGDWETYDVSNRTVDLTRLQGANATQLTSMNVSNGTYSKVFVYVSEINATLENGEQVNVKLPSEKLQLNKEFTVGNGQAVDFVFDITVRKAGNSGKYILQPVVSQSGTSEDVEIRKVDEEDDEDEEDERENEGREEREDEREDRDDEQDDRAELNASFVGEVTQGENATLRVLDDGTAVQNASVEVNDEVVGTTDANGELTFVVPDDRELDIEITAGDREAELERRFAGKESGSENASNGNDDADYDFRAALA